MWPVAGDDCFRAVPDIRLIKDVVMDKGCQMDELDDSRRLDESRIRWPIAIEPHGENENGPQFLATVAKTILDQGLNFRFERSDLLVKKYLQCGESGYEG